MSWLGLVKLLVPIILKAKVPHGEELSTIAVDAIEGAENIKNSSGKDKLASVISEVKIGAEAINAAYGREKINMQALDETIGDAISSVITGANTVKKAKTVVSKDPIDKLIEDNNKK